METTAVKSYEGIFKFVWSEKAKCSFLKARSLISLNKFSEAVEEFRRTKELCKIDDDVKVVNILLDEIDRYLKHRIPSTVTPTHRVDWSLVGQRNLERLDEDLDRLPQGVFTLKMDTPSGIPLVLLGRKTLSSLWLQNSIPEIFCSQVRSDMLLGTLSDWRMTDTKLIVYFHALTSSEKLTVFNNIVSTGGKGYELNFPFPLLKSVTRKEFTSPDEGWDVDASYLQTLKIGEEHIWKVTVDILQKFAFTAHTLYDPACSTGMFLNSLKTAFPECFTIGQDLSQKMCDVARSRVDQVHWGNSIQPMIEPGTAHCVFNRFLNSEVVTSADAELLLSALLPTVAVGGVMITFGHTPVLLSSSIFNCIEGFELLSNVAFTKDASSVFQYYIIRRIF